MRSARVGRLLRRSGAVLLAIALAGLLNGVVALAQDGGGGEDHPPELVERGAQLFQLHCALCHGDRGRGLEQPGASGGPSLQGVGAASADFMLRTGRMPIDHQNEPLRRSRPQFSDAEIDALVAFVASLGDGPPIPDVSGWEDADLARGLEEFTTHCAACHGPTAAGIAVGQRDVSSNLAPASPVEIAEAVRTGPGVMPVFGGDVVDDEDLESVVRWVVHLRDRAQPGGLSIGRSGPVAEGFVAWVIGMGLLGIVMYLLGQRTEEGGADE